MTQEWFLAIVRHGLTWVGGWLMARGIFDQSMADLFTAGFIALAGLGWSMWRKYSRRNAEVEASKQLPPDWRPPLGSK